MEVVPSVIQIMDCLFKPAGSELHHLLHYDNNIKELGQQVQKLVGIRERVQEKIEDAKSKREILYADVKNWIVAVDNISEEVAKFLEEDKVKKRCLRGWCINLRSRYEFNREAEKKLKVIVGLQNDAKFSTVSHPARPSGFESSSTEFSSSLKSRKLIMKEVMEAMSDDNVNVIGICGMAGVGKTTLMKEITKQANEDKLYPVVVMAVVSQQPNIVNIQGEIAGMLGEQLGESARANSLLKAIKTKKQILVVLDDVWGRIELDKIGIPFGKDHGGCKIIVISPSKTVCKQMDCKKIFTVETLSVTESWILFKELADGNIDNSDINPSAREICAKCGGLPIAIATIARELKDTNKHVWRHAARQLKKSSLKNIEGLQETVFSPVELTFNHLGNEAKSLFLLCSLFPADFGIPIEDLMRYGMGLRLFTGKTMDEARDEAHALVSTLTSSFLLIIDDDEESVRMNVVIRDCALIMAPKHDHIFMVEASAGIKEWPTSNTSEKLSYISLMSNDIQEVHDGLEFPNLQALLLQKNSKLVVPNNNFFQGMKGLKVLDLSETKLSPLPTSLSSLVNLRTLYLNQCILGDLSVIGELRNLEILRLFDSNVKEIPTSFKQLSNLKLLDVNRCRQLKKISSVVLNCLCNLEELYLLESCSDIEILKVLQTLSQLNSLQICIPVLPDSLRDVKFEKLTSFILQIGLRECIWDKRRYSKNMVLSCMDISKIFEWVKNLLQKAEDLLLIEISGSENLLHDIVNEEFSDLKSLAIHSCKIKYLLNTLEWIPNLTFCNLEKLKIDGNPELVEICNGEPPSQSFSRLKILEVGRCNKMSTIIPSLLLKRLQNLETVKADDCKSVECIFDFDGLKIKNEETMLILPLKELKLIDLPMMKDIFKGNHQLLSLRNLKVIFVRNCPNLKELFSPSPLQSLICLEEIYVNDCDNLEEIFGKGKKEDVEKRTILCSKNQTRTSPSLGNLTSLSIRGCSKLKTLFTPSIVKSLVRLRTLRLYACSIIQEIVIKEDGVEGTSTNKIVFPSLYNLELDKLDNLTCFSSGSCIVEFLTLETLTINECPEMKKFGNGDQVTPKLKSVFLNRKYQMMDNLNHTIESFHEKIVQAKELKAKLTKLPKNATTETSVMQENEVEVD